MLVDELRLLQPTVRHINAGGDEESSATSQPPMYSHINPYATWSNSHVRKAVPGVPSVHGALPFAADPSASNLVIFYFTAFKPSILNCTVIGQNTYPYFKITTDVSMPGYTAVKNPDGKTVALIEWKNRPLAEIRNVFSKQRVSDWLPLSKDAR